MKLIIISLFICLTNIIFSQNDSIKRNNISIKTCISSLHVPYVGRSLRIGFEYNIRANYSLEHEIGLFFDNSTGSIFRTDIKKYLTGGNNVNYISLDLFYKNQKYSNADSIYGVLKQYTVNKKVETFSLKYGKIIRYKSGFLLDFYCGIGIRFQQNKNSLSSNDNQHLPTLYDYNTNWILNKEQNRIYPNLLAGLKIGYQF